jgi:hypothetical protein
MTSLELELFERLVVALEQLASCVKAEIVQTKDVDREKVYSEHLGKKLRK